MARGEVRSLRAAEGCVNAEPLDVRLQRQGAPRRRRMWPNSYPLTTLTAADEARISALVTKAVS
jgi:hypothetical protein